MTEPSQQIRLCRPWQMVWDILADAYKDAFAKDCGEKSLMMQVKKGSKYQRGKCLFMTYLK